MDLLDTTVATLAEEVRTRRLGARELTAHCLERIEALDPEINAFVAVDAERALHDAEALDARLASGDVDLDRLPLAGIPFGVKDLEDAVGYRTTKGSVLRLDAPEATQDSILVARLRAAGGIVVGKTNTPEHGFTADTYNGILPATRNPWDLERSPGGSSGGSAAAIAAGMVPLCTGSDGGGSIRIPSALCGLSGMKASQGRVPNGGPTPPGSGLFTVKGPMARSIHDVALALAAVVGPDPTDPFSLPNPHEPWTGILDEVHLPAQVGWAPDLGYDVDPEVRRVTGAAVDRLADAGVEVVEVGAIFPDDPVGPFFTLWTASLLRSYEHVRGTPDWDLVTPGVRDLVEYAIAHVGPADVTRAIDAIHHLNFQLAATLHDTPLLLTPAVAGRTPMSEHLGTIDSEETPLWVRFSYPLNLTRNPAGVVSAGLDVDGLPVGLQVIGPQHADVAVLRALAAFEGVLGLPVRGAG